MEERKYKIFVIEGTDGSGKATQAKRLVERLNTMAIPCTSMSFPTYNTPTGRIVGECYLGKRGESWFGDADAVESEIASMYYAANRRAEIPTMKNALTLGHLVLDRYVYSNMAHQGGKFDSEEERKNFFKFIEEFEFGLLKIPKEDKTIFLYVPTPVAVGLREKRSKETGEKADGHESNIQHLRRAEETYLQLADYFKWDKIDCVSKGKMRSEQDIGDEVFERVKPLLE